MCTGCPECLQKCNVELKEKLRILFPTCEQKILDDVLPVEDGILIFGVLPVVVHVAVFPLLTLHLPQATIKTLTSTSHS